jgi:hypothetical protein
MKQARKDADEIGGPPAHLTPDLAALWRELAESVPVGAAGASDRGAFELLTHLAAKLRAGTISAAEVSQLKQLFHEFGMTPTGRVRLSATKFV